MADDRKIVPIRKVRAWARDRGLPVGTRGHLSQDLIDQFNRAHRKVAATNSNPMTPANQQERDFQVLDTQS